MNMIGNTIILADSEFKLSADLLSDYLKAKNIKLEEGGYTAQWKLNLQSGFERAVDEETNSTQWKLKDRLLYLNAFKACVDNKEVNISYLFPTMVANSIPIVARWITQKIEVKFWEMKSLSNYIVIELDEGIVSKVYHKQKVRNTINNEVVSEIEEEISHERLVELIEIIPKMEVFDSSIYCFMAEGLDRNEIAEKLTPRDLYYDELDSLTIRLLEIMRLRPRDFRLLLSLFYPFTINDLRNYQKSLIWWCLGKNEFLDWSWELLKEFESKWHSYQLDDVLRLFRKSKNHETGIPACLNPPELEEIISLLEKVVLFDDFGDNAVKELSQIFGCDNSYIFNGYDNSINYGFDYIFNTLEKRKVLDDSVEVFLIEQSYLDHIDKSMDFIKEEKLLLLPKVELTPFYSFVAERMKAGRSESEIAEELIPRHPFFGELDPMTVRLFKIMERYDVLFSKLLCRYYPFTIKDFKDYSELLDWAELSENEFIDWTEELLDDIKCKLRRSCIGNTLLRAKGKSDKNFIKKANEMGLISEYQISKYENSHKVEKNPNALTPPKELGELISQLEQDIKRGEVLKGDAYLDFLQGTFYQLPRIFDCDNSLENGFEYTFNTPEKKMILKDAVTMFLTEFNNVMLRWKICSEISNVIKGDKKGSSKWDDRINSLRKN